MGILARDTGRSLSSDRWKPFLRFVGTEAPRGLGVMGRSVGDVAHGLAELVMAFLPATQDLERGILAVARDFDRWATSLGKTQGFQDFLDYISTNGPKVLDLLGATARTFIDIGRAAAPLGGPILDTLTAFLNIIDSIANSNLGTPIFTGIVAMRLMTRATQLWGKVSTTSAGQFIAGQRDAVGCIGATITAEQRAVLTTTELAAAQQKTSAGWATIRGGALKAGAAGLGFGLIASGCHRQAAPDQHRHAWPWPGRWPGRGVRRSAVRLGWHSTSLITRTAERGDQRLHLHAEPADRRDHHQHPGHGCPSAPAGWRPRLG
jgi:hypothetical protein